MGMARKRSNYFCIVRDSIERLRSAIITYREPTTDALKSDLVRLRGLCDEKLARANKDPDRRLETSQVDDVWRLLEEIERAHPGFKLILPKYEERP